MVKVTKLQHKNFGFSCVLWSVIDLSIIVWFSQGLHYIELNLTSKVWELTVYSDIQSELMAKKVITKYVEVFLDLKSKNNYTDTTFWWQYSVIHDIFKLVFFLGEFYFFLIKISLATHITASHDDQYLWHLYRGVLHTPYCSKHEW